jgi:hypothetical protein
MLTASMLILLTGIQVNSPQAPRLEDYPVLEVFRGTPAAPRLDTAEARRFRTELRRQAASGPDFAGRFILARWGCGADCVSGAIIDARTGKVWLPKFRVEDAVAAQRGLTVHHSTDFQVESELVIAIGLVNDQGMGTAYFRWHDGTLSLIRFERARN